MADNVKIGAALVGGYLLGRTKKAKLAIGFGMFLAGKKLDLDPKKIGGMLVDSPLLGGLSDQVRKDLVGATRTAATNALTQRATSLADSLHERTLRLDDPDAAREEGERDADGAEGDDARGEAEDGTTGREDRDEEPGEKPARSRKSASGRGASRGSGGPKKAASTAGRTASQATRAKAPAKKAAAKSRSTRGGSRG
ncbi:MULTISPECIES: hypothetical protein [Streptomyces]|uniref:DNA primase n=4 Tax=Streptomyces TaxID=1883 RepID=A0A8H9HQQ0_9ACTN|nr:MULTISPECIES: hypothetical protein [Streptomyces]NEE31723.1 hypothetical protein [Streptomyces sp. SID7982]MBL3805275.1 hypothetical protein [Streptomyces sp. BRB081]MDQ0294064.1 hypothetical protein [Streptomyces sp. DSM 41037]PJM82096.1 hypothetical protein CH313_19280 [Streptomyces sp. TSRI0384-2]QNE82487.1 hypothetical protein F0345_16360 [Streptomyces rutgersensis]